LVIELQEKASFIFYLSYLKQVVFCRPSTDIRKKTSISTKETRGFCHVLHGEVEEKAGHGFFLCVYFGFCYQ
jgi:hypothetical protein